MSTALATDQLAIPGAESFEKPENGSTAIQRIIEKAIFDPTFAPEKLAVLLDVQLKYEANEARKQFEHAFQMFKRNAPEILKTKLVSFATSGGKSTEYQHAELDKITPIIGEALLSYGISQSWRTSDANGKTTVTCILKGFGHTEEASTLSGPSDTSGGKNSIQAIGSTVTYLCRYTLLSAVGIAAKGSDDDGKTEGIPEVAIDEYCMSLKDAADFPELKAKFAHCWEVAKKVNDRDAMGLFQKVYEDRKKELRDKL